MADLPVAHVIRAVPPWRRDPPLTECGKDPSSVETTLTRDEFVAKVRTEGKTRAAMTTCMTCWGTAARHHSWEHNPAEVMARECSRYPDDEKARMTAELRALAALVAAHEDEFFAYIDGLQETASLAAARRRRARDRARGVDSRHPRPL